MGALVTESKAFIQVRMIIFLLITLSACAADNFPITNHVNMSEEFIEPPYDVKSGGCPPLSTIPVANLHAYLPRDDYFYAGRYYKGQGNDLTNLACNGDAFEIPDGYQKSATYGSVFPMGSILVNPGCTVYLYDTYNWEGNYRYKYSGGREGITIPKVPVGNIPGYPACFRSYSWSCAQSFPSCGPWDDWRYITTLNNSDSNSTKTFTFQQKIGTTLSDAIEQSMSVSDRVAASLYFNFSTNSQCNLDFLSQHGSAGALLLTKKNLKLKSLMSRQMLLLVKQLRSRVLLGLVVPVLSTLTSTG